MEPSPLSPDELDAYLSVLEGHGVRSFQGCGFSVVIELPPVTPPKGGVNGDPEAPVDGYSKLFKGGKPAFRRGEK